MSEDNVKELPDRDRGDEEDCDEDHREEPGDQRDGHREDYDGHPDRDDREAPRQRSLHASRRRTRCRNVATWRGRRRDERSCGRGVLASWLESTRRASSGPRQ